MWICGLCNSDFQNTLFLCIYRSIVYNIIKYKTMTKSGDLLLVDFFQQNDVLYTVQTSS